LPREPVCVPLVLAPPEEFCLRSRPEWNFLTCSSSWVLLWFGTYWLTSPGYSVNCEPPYFHMMLFVQFFSTLDHVEYQVLTAGVKATLDCHPCPPRKFLASFREDDFHKSFSRDQRSQPVKAREVPETYPNGQTRSCVSPLVSRSESDEW